MKNIGKIELKQQIFWFIVPTYLITYAISVIGYFKGGMDHFPVMAISMYVPAVTIILLYWLKFRMPIFRKSDLGFQFKGFKYLFIAPVVMFLIVSLGYFIPFFLNTEFFMNSNEILLQTEKSGIGIGHWLGNLFLIFGINLFIAPMLNILMMLGEEIGWRAFLVPRLIRIFGTKIGFVLGGSIWALWHAGGIILGLNYPGYPISGNAMMIFMCIPLGIILQYLYAKSKSIFVPAIAHGAVNWTSSTFMMFVLSDAGYNKFLYGPTGIVGISLMCIVAYFLYNRVNWQQEYS